MTMNAAACPDGDGFLVGDVVAFGNLRGVVIAVTNGYISILCGGKKYKVHSANHKLRKWPPSR